MTELTRVDMNRQSKDLTVYFIITRFVNKTLKRAPCYAYVQHQ